MKAKPKARKAKHSPAEAVHVHRPHSPFFLIWELVTGTCVMFVGLAILIVPSLHLEESTLHEVERWVFTSELILIVEVVLLLLVARNKIHFIKTKWTTILAVLPFGASFRFIQVGKVGWHAFEKTRFGHFFRHPVKNVRRWAHSNLGLRV